MIMMTHFEVKSESFKTCDYIEWNVTKGIREGKVGYFLQDFCPKLEFLLCLQARACVGSNKGSNFKERQNMLHKNIPQTRFLAHVVFFCRLKSNLA